MTGDEELFEQLQRLVVPPDREPPSESVAALRAAVARQFPSRRKRPWWQRKITVGAALFGLVTGTPAAAFALGGAPLPDPLRTALHAMGLPVDSVPVADTKAAENGLEHALRDHNPAQITKAADHLEICLAELDPADRTRMAPKADELLEVAASGGGRDTESSPDAPSERQEGGASSSGGHQESTPGSTSGSDGSGDHLGATPTTAPTGGTGTQPTGAGSDGDRSTTTTTRAPATSQSDGDTSGSSTTTTTLQRGGSSGDGGSDSSGGGGTSSGG